MAQCRYCLHILGSLGSGLDLGFRASDLECLGVGVQRVSTFRV